MEWSGGNTIRRRTVIISQQIQFSTGIIIGPALCSAGNTKTQPQVIGGFCAGSFAASALPFVSFRPVSFISALSTRLSALRAVGLMNSTTAKECFAVKNQSAHLRTLLHTGQPAEQSGPAGRPTY